MKPAQAFDVIVDSLKLWWNDWGNQVVVSLVAILVSLTVVLLPAALFGIYQETLDLTHRERSGLIGFWNGFKKSLVKSLGWGAINLVVLLVLSTNIWFYYNSQLMSAPTLTIITIIMGVLWIIWQFFSLSCYFLQEEQTLKLAWKNGLVVILKQPFYALIISSVMLALLALSFTVYIPLVLGSIPLMAILGLKAVQATIK
ncbi:MAG: hypothetical protein PHW11_02110 [Anaerolineaceae bacterium]|jgi:uncharacterized membrane protein YesL|nr:hypothetical protein [Anaerolineaceae bacterium]MDD4043049.1 hypothetical protein [Anaerolineaceae bacterium]MDD4577273.1 hypothetical protein [Anaerolineaceae bacterium]